MRVRLRRYISAGGSTKAAVDSTFISRPMGPVLLTVTISISDTASVISSAAAGPSRKPAMAMITSFRS